MGNQAGAANVSINLNRGGNVFVSLSDVDIGRLSAGDFIFAKIDSPQEIYGGYMSNLFGGAGNDRLHASGQSYWMFGEGGDDVLYAADNGSALMVGGAGRDIFTLASGGGYVQIKDFTQGQDRIDLTALGISSFDTVKSMLALPVPASGSDSFQIGNTTLTMNIAKAKLTAADFILAAGDPTPRYVTTIAAGNALAGGAGNDTLVGSSNADRLFGGDGDDTLMDDPYETSYSQVRDVMVGGAGNDRFVINHLYGVDVIADFTPGQDKLDLSALGITSFDTVMTMAEQARLGGKVATVLRTGVDWNNSTLTLLLDRSKLSAADIILATQDQPLTRQATTEKDVFGGSAGDRLTGNGANNRLFGEAGDDTLTGGQGNDQLYGGAGTDTAQFSGNFADYKVSSVNGIVTVQHLTGNDGTDTLIGVEKLAFADRTLDQPAATPPVLNISGRTVLEGDRGSVPIIVEGKITGSLDTPQGPGPKAGWTISLSAPAAEAVTFDVGFVTGTGYVLDGRSYTIAAGQTTLNIDGPTGGGTGISFNYSHIATLTNVRGALVPTQNGNISATTTILDDDYQPDFSLTAYRAMNTSLDHLFDGNDSALITHYINNGRQEGRIAAGFDAEAYAAQNPDLYKAFGLDATALLHHFQTAGYKEGRVAEGFDAVAYAALNPDLYKVLGLNHGALVEHYIAYGEKEGRLASGFDAESYAALNPDLFRAYGLDEAKLVDHFVRMGHAEGRAAIGFSAEAYAAFSPDLYAAFGLDHAALVQHYISNGQAEGRKAYTLTSTVPPTPDLSMLASTPGWGSDYYW